jgi:hypothetical protein
MALDFSRYLDVPVDEITQPKPLPAGTYFATIVKHENREVEFEKGTKTPVTTISFRLTASDEDVDPDLLPEGGGVGRIVTKDYRLNDPDRQGQWALRRLGEETLGLPGKGKHLSDLINEFVHQECKVFNQPRPNKNEEGQFFPNITRVLPMHEKVANGEDADG